MAKDDPEGLIDAEVVKAKLEEIQASIHELSSELTEAVSVLRAAIREGQTKQKDIMSRLDNMTGEM